MSTKTKAIWGAAVTGITAGLSHISSLAPSLQDAFVQKLQAVFPVAWRPEISAICGFIAICALIYTALHASKSGPSTPP